MQTPGPLRMDGPNVFVCVLLGSIFFCFFQCLHVGFHRGYLGLGGLFGERSASWVFWIFLLVHFSLRFWGAFGFCLLAFFARERSCEESPDMRLSVESSEYIFLAVGWANSPTTPTNATWQTDQNHQPNQPTLKPQAKPTKPANLPKIYTNQTNPQPPTHL